MHEQPDVPDLPAAIANLLEILPDAVVAVDARLRVVYANPAIRNLLGYRQDELIGQPLSVLVPLAVRERHDGLMTGYLRSGEPLTMGSRRELRALHRSGRLVPVSISLCKLPLPGGDSVSVAVVHDVSALHTRLDHATRQANTDALTGLGNRLLLSRQMGAGLENRRPFGLLMLDLTGFKAVNDRHGHAAGDQALRVVGRRLQSLVRDTDLAVRLGGDEFVLLLDGMADADHLQERTCTVVDHLTQPMRLDDVTVTLGVNVGGAAYPAHGDSETALLDAADRAMYAAKRAGESYRSAG